MNRAELKERARNSLSGKFKDVIIFFLIYYGIDYALTIGIGMLRLGESLTSLLTIIVSLVWGGLIYFGYKSFFLKLSRNEEVTYNELFSKTNLFWPCIGLSLLIGLFTFLWSLLFIIPGIIASINYSIAYYVALDNPELGMMEVLRKSKEIMKGHKMEWFILTLSFMGWYIIGLFTCGLLYLWVEPYMLITMANFYNRPVRFGFCLNFKYMLSL